MKRVAIATGLVTAALLRNAYAQSAAEDVRIEYSAPEDCPSEDWVLRRIGARTDRFHRIVGAGDVRTFAMQVMRAGSVFSGTLKITEPGRPRATSRRIAAENCDEVADGLALIAALTIDPQARLEAQEEKPPEREQPERPHPPPSPANVPPPIPVAPAPRTVTFYVQPGSGFAGMSGVAPTFLYGAEGFLEAGFARKQSWFSPALRLTLQRVRHDATSVAEGTAHFRLSTVGLDVCPLSAPVPSLGLGLCGKAEMGWLEAEGTDVAEPQQSRRGWAALGALMRASAWMSRVGIEATLGVEAPLRRDRFEFTTRIGEVQPVVLFVGLAVTGRI